VLLLFTPSGTPLRWQAGQWVTVTSPQHGLDGAQSRIVGVEWEFLNGEGARRAVVRFGGDRLRLRSGGTGNVSGATVTGQVG
jgi:hypothetical protein